MNALHHQWGKSLRIEDSGRRFVRFTAERNLLRQEVRCR
jgi:hypothetical protein